MKLFNFSEIYQKAESAFLRFPITLTWAILGTFFVIYIVEFDLDFDNYVRETSTLFLGISWLIGTQFFIEQQKGSKPKMWLFIITIALLLIFYFHLPKEDSFKNPIYYTRFLLYVFAGHLFLFVSPFLNSWNKNAFWNYLKSIFIAIGRSLLFSIVLYLGLSLALLAIEYLFVFEIKGERYFQIFIFCLGIVNTWTYLSDFPKNIQEQTTINYNKALEVFVKYILIPLVILYLIILYAYSFKILFTWNLPKGWVSYLVIALSLLGFIIQTMINPIQKTIKSPVINRFHPWFYYLLTPLLLLLFIAIFKRIGDYGFTENRYFILILALWITGMTGYLLFSKNKYLKILPLTLTIVTLLISIGFWSAFNISKISQLSEFKQAFRTAKLNKNIATKEEYETLESVLRYFYKRDKLDLLDSIVGVKLDSVYLRRNGKFKNNYYLNTTYILDSLNIIKPKENDNLDSKYMSFVLDKTTLNTDLNNYQKLYYISFQKQPKNSIDSIYTFEIINHETQAVIKEHDTILFELNLKSLIDKNPSDYYYELPEEDLIFNFKNDKVLMKLIIESLNINIEKGDINIQNLTAFVLIK
ncbi:DUF4153 domain-containing protein [Confluentibacter sediminis]|uniref:DUF4153 domain-containing protein n=1 Tax=Confluentibacter sediminis TaxID=2219045 RepID=UPI000DAC524A|nr:DUF4153 domain-containing protein [Confluentibacter sediminis]